MALSYDMQSLVYYVVLQVKQIAPYWLLGLGAGSVLSGYGHKLFAGLAGRLPKGMSALSVVFAALLGALSPITLHGMIPILAALLQLNVGQHIVAAFIISSVLINPNVIVYSFALGTEIALLRLFLCVLAGSVAGALTCLAKGRPLFNIQGFMPAEGRKEQKGLKAVGRNFIRSLRKTGPNLALGIVLAALFQVYFPADWFELIFHRNRGLSVLYSATLGVPVYYCGGGTIPLLRAWIQEGMSVGSAVAFMLTGPATKFTNLTAVKIIMPGRKFWLYIVYAIVFGIAAGLAVDLVSRIIQQGV